MKKSQTKETSEVAAKAIHYGWKFDNSYSRLPETLYVRQNPVPVLNPQIAIFNHPLAASLGLNAKAFDDDGGVGIFSGNLIPEGATPISQAYAGHQFGHFTMLGDGRAVLLGEHMTPQNARFDIQLKGSGQTAFSRRGDGRATLGSMLREYIISEAMHALSIPTTRSLAVVTTGEQVLRETKLPGAILTRVASSHIRVGTFEFMAAQSGHVGTQKLADYTLHRHYPEIIPADYLSLLNAIMERQAALIAQWQMIGFIHGVMNTDNMSISGETIDYGPCAFMDVYNPATVFSSIDYHGRYAYENQPDIAHWNLTRLAECLVPLLHENQDQAIAMAKKAIESFPSIFQRYWIAGMRAKIGLLTDEADDISLIETLLKWMAQHHADFTNTFRALTLDELPNEPLFHDPSFGDWHKRWQLRIELQAKPKETSRSLMRSRNPNIIPRNHRVAEALDAAVERSDFTVMARLLAALKNPYEDSPQHAFYQTPPTPNERVYKTFCGT